MLIYETKNDLIAHLNAVAEDSKKTGFVPTMGALHHGHLSLIAQSLKEGHYTVCSIFVNPTQFNNPSDLIHYPRTVEQDLLLLEKSGCNVVFIPPVSEIYPQKDNRSFHFGNLDKILEGAFRPGHFNGVAQVVSILFDIVKPHTAYFGKKDYQQLLIIKELVNQLHLNINIIGCATLRETDGLAMSSRNVRLSATEREAAKLIPAMLEEAKKMKQSGFNFNAIKNTVLQAFETNPLYKPEYFDICNPDTLESLNDLKPESSAIALMACYVGEIRLIDNLEL